MATAAPTKKATAKPTKTATTKPEKKAKAKKPEKKVFVETDEAKEFLGAEKKKIVQDPATGEKRTKLIRRLSKVPTTWNPEKHKPLKRGDFEPDSAYLLLEFKADRLEAQAKALREEAKSEKQDGNKGVKSKKKKLGSLKSQMAKIVGELGEDPDLDIDSILSEAGIDPNMLAD